MRKVIIGLSRVFGQEHAEALTHWVNAQYLVKTVHEGEVITLHDVSETKILDAILTAATSVNLEIHDVVDGLILVPCLSGNKLDFDVVIEVLPKLFEKSLTANGKIIINSMDFVREGELFEYNTQSEHVIHDAGRYRENKKILSYINISTSDDFKFSAVLHTQEIEGIIRSFQESKYNECVIEEPDLWESIIMSSTFRRLYDLPIFSKLISSLTPAQLHSFKSLINLSKERFFYVENADNSYVAYGNKIATKFNRFDAVSRREQQVNKDYGHLRIVASSEQSDDVVEFDSNAEDSKIATVWGDF